MGAKTGISILLLSLFLVGAVGAVGVPDTITVTTNKLWTIANNGDQSKITIIVTNTTPGYAGAVPGATVNLAVDPVYGFMTPATVITDPSGIAVSTFQTWNRSGTAQITATSPDTMVSGSVFQNIDHDTLVPVFSPKAGTVGEVISFNVLIADQWGNPIDTRRGEENTVSLTVSCPMPNDCEFAGYGHSYSAHPDADGNLSVPLRLGTKTGYTAVVMSPVQDLGQKETFIDTVGSGMVLLSEISPGIVPPYSVPTVPVGKSFSFAYTLTDTYGNPVANKQIEIVTSEGEVQSTATNAMGITPLQTYSRSSLGTVTITGTVVNTNMTNVMTVAFTTSEPKEMMLSVTPQIMGSREYDPASQADVVVRVFDDFGNPLSGQEIAFNLTYTPGANWNVNPTLASYSGTTDAEGKLKTVFIPGGFNTTKNSDGTCLLTATWKSKPSYSPKTATVAWTNYPYLNIYATATPETVKVNETFDVTIKVAVNGKKGLYKPLTIMLDQDCSASMKNPSDLKGQSRLDAAAYAATFLIDAMDVNNTQMGLESYGYDQTPYTPLPILSGQSQLDLVKYNYAHLKGLTSSKGMEDSIWRSFYNITATAHERDVKVFIMLSDGGSQLDNQGVLPSLISYAKTNDIVVFPITYLSGGGSGTAAVQMSLLANETGGMYYEGDSAADLIWIFEDITDRIQILADTNTTMMVSFKTVMVNSTTMPGIEVYEYVPVGPFTDMQATPNNNLRTSIIWPNSSQTVLDQSAQWPELQFNVGAIQVGQNWSTTFRLKAKQPGSYNVFGPGSKVIFDGGSSSATLPDLPINVLPDLTNGGMLTGSLAVWDLRNTTAPSSYDQFSDFIPLQWNTKYESKTSSNVVKEYAYYRINGGSWKQFDFRTVSVGESTQTATLDVRSLPSGTYDIKIEAYPNAKDSNDATSNILTVTVGRQSASPYLNLT